MSEQADLEKRELEERYKVLRAAGHSDWHILIIFSSELELRPREVALVGIPPQVKSQGSTQVS